MMPPSFSLVRASWKNSLRNGKVHDYPVRAGHFEHQLSGVALDRYHWTLVHADVLLHVLDIVVEVHGVDHLERACLAIIMEKGLPRRTCRSPSRPPEPKRRSAPFVRGRVEYTLAGSIFSGCHTRYGPSPSRLSDDLEVPDPEVAFDPAVRATVSAGVGPHERRRSLRP